MMRGDAFEGDPEFKAGRHRTKSAVIAGAIMILGTVVAFAFCVGRGTAPPEVARVLPTPQPTPTVPAVTAEAMVNGVRLWDDEAVAWLSLYRDNEDLLGQPLGWIGVTPTSDNKACVAFEYYVICHVKDELVTGIWRYPPLTLGSSALPDSASAELDAPLAAPAVAYVDTIKASGRDAMYWLGRTTSRETCSADECVQYFERAVLRWPNAEDVEPDQVSQAPLGRAYASDKLETDGVAGVAIE
jgi:hypothetical protein